MKKREREKKEKKEKEKEENEKTSRPTIDGETQRHHHPSRGSG